MSTENLTHLISKYDARVPRYTSYPTAADFITFDDSRIAQDAIRAGIRVGSSKPVSLYIHLPFCASLCWFCACNKVVAHDQSVVEPYLEALNREIALVSDVAGGRISLGQVHLGGGSPTFLSSHHMETLFSSLRSQFDGFETASKSIELDPRTTTPEQLAVLAAAGFTRASIGVQDFNEVVQRAVHRVQPKELVQQVVDQVREAGFKSVNFDLIYGLPQQTEHSMRETISDVLTLRPDRIALYGYAHVQWKVKVQRALEKFTLPTAEERVALFSLAEEELLTHGYVSLGLDHFALPSDELVAHAEARTLHRTFMGYTTVEGEGVLGLGVSAISDIGNTLYQNEVDLGNYYNMLVAGKLPVVRGRVRTADDTVRAYIIERIMCDGELVVDEAPLAVREGVEAAVEEALPRLRLLERDDLLRAHPGKLVATFNGRFFLRTIASVFDAHLAHTTAGYSQAV